MTTVTLKHISPPDAKRMLCIRSFSLLDKEIEHDGRKFIPIRELARIAGFSLVDFPILSWGAGSGFEKGNYRVSNIPLNTETQLGKYHAFVFSINKMTFYYENPNGRRVIENQFQLYHKLREWGFIE